jgi:hypothetical protein
VSQAIDNGLPFAFPQIIQATSHPFLGLFATFSEESLPHSPEAVAGVTPIHNLYGFGEESQGNPFDPTSPIVDRAELFDGIETAPKPFCIQVGSYLVCTPQACTVAVVMQMDLWIAFSST